MAKIDISTLSDCFLFKHLDKNEIEIVASLFYEKKLASGKTVFVEQMPGESLYLIKSGRVKISKLIAEGDEKILVTLNPHDVFGEMAILDGAPRSATARVEDDAVLLSIKKSDFEKLCEAKPKIALHIMRNIVTLFSSRIRQNNEEYREMLMWSLSDSA